VLHPYLDQVGYPTIGWGSRYGLDGKEITMKSPSISLEEADTLLRRDVKKFEEKINSSILVPLTQKKFDSLVSFSYNLGSILGLKEKINSGTITKKDFIDYSFARDQKTKKMVQLPVLVKRRSEEADLFFS
jgi:lysozyme